MIWTKAMAGAIIAVIAVLASPLCPIRTVIAAPSPDQSAVEVSVNITQDVVLSCVEPPENRLTYVTGTVHVSAPYLPVNHRLILSLRYDARSSRTEWFAQGTEEIYFSKGYSQGEFICTMKIPDSTYVDDIGSLTVSGRWTISPNGGTGEAVPDSVRIEILPYSYPLIEAYDEIIMSEPGQEMGCRMALTNLGNGPDEFDLAYICPVGTRIIGFPSSKIGLERGDTYRFDFTVISNSTGSKEIKIVANGRFDGNYTPAGANVALAVSDDKVDVPFSHARFATFLVISFVIVLCVGIGITYWLHRKARSRSMMKALEGLER